MHEATLLPAWGSFLVTKPRIQQRGSNLSARHSRTPVGPSNVIADALVRHTHRTRFISQQREDNYRIAATRDQADQASASSPVFIACAYHIPTRTYAALAV
jgi:hypothetical protein